MVAAARLLEGPARPAPPGPAAGDLSRQSLRLLAALRRHHPASADHSIRVATVLLAMSSSFATWRNPAAEPQGTTLAEPRDATLAEPRDTLLAEPREATLAEPWDTALAGPGEIVLAERRQGPVEAEALADPALVVAAGLMHDLGKLFLPVALLDAARGLTPGEMAAMRAHPVTGAETLAALRFPAGVVSAAQDHHERWQGGGYPRGCPGTTLPGLARAVCVADAFVAMIEPGRAYRPRLTVALALAEVQACSGTQFDPTFAKLLVEGLGPAFEQELGLDAAPGCWQPRSGDGLLSHRLEHALGLPPCPW